MNPSSPDESGPSSQLRNGAIPSSLIRIAPFLLPALMLESGILLLFSPIALFILTLKNTSWLSLLALVTNAAILVAFQDKEWIPRAFWLWSIVGSAFPMLIRKFGRVIPAMAMCFVFGLTVFYINLTVISLQENMGVVEFVKHQIAFYVESQIQLYGEPFMKMVEEQGGRDEVRRVLLDAFPSLLIVLYFLTYWLNILVASSLLRGFLPRSFWGSYKNPEWLVWPTLIFGAGYVFGKFAIYYISLNFFVFMLTLYAAQGFSIISFLLTHFKVRPLGRSLVFVGAIFGTSPFIISLGFFDQWFDFRKKLGQS